jgi:hypothetical protein
VANVIAFLSGYREVAHIVEDWPKIFALTPDWQVKQTGAEKLVQEDVCANALMITGAQLLWLANVDLVGGPD